MQNKLIVKLDFGFKQEYTVGTLYYSKDERTNVFQYEPSFIRTQFEISPIALPLNEDTYFAEKKMNSIFFIMSLLMLFLTVGEGKFRSKSLRKKELKVLHLLTG